MAADDAVQLTEGVDGPQSFQAVVDNLGVGSFVVVQKGLVVISLHTAMPTGETPIRDPDELLETAKGVTAKLPLGKGRAQGVPWFACNAAEILPGVMGSLRIRTPVAAWTAFAIAASGGTMGASPTPRTP